MRLADQAALVMFSRLAERTVGIVSSLALVRLLTQEDFGTYLQVSLVGTMFTTLVLLGLPQSLLFFLPQESPGSRKALIARTTLLTLAVALPVGALLATGSPMTARILNNPALAPLGLLIGLYTVLYALNRLLEPAFIGLGQARRVGQVALWFSLLLVVATIVPAALGWPVGWIYASVLAAYLARLVYFGFAVKGLSGPPAWSGSLSSGLRRQLRFSVPLGLATISGQYNRQLDAFIVSYFFAPMVFAVYSRGAFELPLIELLPYSLSTVILPRLVTLWEERSLDRFSRLWNDSVRVSSLAILPAFVYCFLFADEIIVTLFTESYRDAIVIFRIYLLALPLRLTSYGVILQAMGDTRTIMRTSFLGLVANGILTTLLCRGFGPAGAASGYVASQVLQVGLLLFVIHRHTRLTVSGLMPWRQLAAVGVTAAGVGFAAWIAGGMVAGVIPRLAVTGILFLILCPVGYHLAGLIGPGERDLLKRWAASVPRLPGGRPPEAGAGTKHPEGDTHDDIGQPGSAIPGRRDG